MRQGSGSWSAGGISGTRRGIIIMDGVVENGIGIFQKIKNIMSFIYRSV